MKNATALMLSSCLVLLSAGPAFTQDPSQEPTPENKPAAPVAYIYVARPTHIDSFAAAANGKLTAVKGSPISGSVYGMSVNKKYLFGLDLNYYGGSYYGYINAYTIESDGAIALTAQTLVPVDFCPGGPLQIDYTGKVVYELLVDCWNTFGQSVESLEIESKGSLKYLGNTPLSGNEGYSSFPEPVILGNNKFAYNAGFANGPFFNTYTVERDGLMVVNSATFQAPPAYSGDGTAWPELLAGDTSDHVVVLGQDYNDNTYSFDGPVFLATYTADSDGNLTTKSSPENMATVSPALYDAGYPYGVDALSIDPTSKLLAVGGDGFQLFHWNGGEPVTDYAGVMLGGDEILQFGWDTSHHLYVLTSSGDVYVYTVTPTSVKEAPGSPYSIPEASGIIVLSE